LTVQSAGIPCKINVLPSMSLNIMLLSILGPLRSYGGGLSDVWTCGDTERAKNIVSPLRYNVRVYDIHRLTSG
jgi:hypothetical protein